MDERCALLSSGLCLLLLLDWSACAAGRRASREAASQRPFKLSLSDHLEYIRQSKDSFRDKTLAVSIVVREPFVIFNEPHDWARLSPRDRQLAREDLDNYAGIAIEVMKRLKSIFRFNTKLTSPADNQFGVYSLESATWNGLMGQLARREVDIGVTALSLTITRGGLSRFWRATRLTLLAMIDKY